MRSIHFLPAIAISSIIVSACAVTKPSAPGTESRVRVEKWIGSQRSELSASGEPSSRGIPIVDFGAMPANFGKPQWSTANGGTYEVGYFEDAKTRQGQCFSLSVFGCSKPAPVLDAACSVLEPGRPGQLDESPRTWTVLHVPGLKRNLRYQFSTSAFGDSDNTWKTEPFTVSSSDGRSGSYQASVECENAEVAAAMFAKLRVR